MNDAAFAGDLDALRDRIAQGDDVDGRIRGGWTALMSACNLGHHECAQALIEAGAAVDMVDNDGHTALMVACDWGHLECAQALIGARAAVDMVNNRGLTALMWACFSGHHECAQALIFAGAAVDMVDNHGETALMRACIPGRHECARALIDAHADLELTNRDGQNALMIACESPPSYLTQSQCQGKIRCALAILAATAPIEVADFPDQAASLKFACDRLQHIETVLSSTHVIEDAPQLARVRDLQTDAQDIIVRFARDMLAIAQLPKPRRSRRLAAKRLVK